MEIYDYQQSFGAWDKTSALMQKAIKEWFALYYQQSEDKSSNPCQRIAYTLVSKLTRGVFAEYSLTAKDPALTKMLRGLDAVRREAVQLALVGGECYLKPCPYPGGVDFQVIPRDNVLVFGRDNRGMPTDMGMAERTVRGQYYYTLLERRRVDDKGLLTISNRLYKSLNDQIIGQEVSLSENPLYADLAAEYTYPVPLEGLGLVTVKTPMVNCVDGSADGVSVYAAAVGLIHAIDKNEAQLMGEFDRGQSRLIVSADMLSGKELTDDLFVGLQDDPENVGIQIFSPQLREQSFLARKQEYLRNVESVIGLKRGLLSDANVEERTATEIASSSAEYSLTIMDFQRMWASAAQQAARLCAGLARLYKLGQVTDTEIFIDWGNGVLYDEDKLWADYRQMVADGLIRPEIALGWRFDLPAETEEQRAVIRERLMPNEINKFKIKNY